MTDLNKLETASEVADNLRQFAVSHLFKGVFKKAWDDLWKEHISNIITESENKGQALINLGDSLTEIFRLNRGEGRSSGGAEAQASLSGGGSAWESLITWYMNLILAGTPSVAIKMNKALIPAPLLEAIAVSYGNIKTNTESDILVVTFPEEQISVHQDKKRFFEDITSFTESYFSKFSLDIIQCKTNWNDNAQIPMLWDMLYSANSFKNTKISIGSSEYSIQSLERFSYSFVTVPTSRGSFKPDNLCVLRVANISGGNYWGQATKAGVASSIKEIFNRNFRSSCADFVDNASKTYQKIDSTYSYFKLI